MKRSQNWKSVQGNILNSVTWITKSSDGICAVYTDRQCLDTLGDS